MDVQIQYTQTHCLPSTTTKKSQRGLRLIEEVSVLVSFREKCRRKVRAGWCEGNWEIIKTWKITLK